jgi:hypothetical protein
MSVTRQMPASAGMKPARTSAQGLGEVSYYDGENRPVTGRAAVPLRELVDDRLFLVS